jgi:hypothetical protein
MKETVSCMQNVCVEELLRREYLEDLRIDGIETLKCVLNM